MCRCFTLSQVDKVALSFAAQSLCEQVSVIYVFAQHSGRWKTEHKRQGVNTVGTLVPGVPKLA